MWGVNMAKAKITQIDYDTFSVVEQQKRMTEYGDKLIDVERIVKKPIDIWLIGNTGMTGKATGVHLHLSIVNLANGQYLDPEKYNYTEAPKEEPKPATKNGFLPARGYFCEGDKGPEIHAMCKFFATHYWGYFGNSRESAKLKLLGKNGDGNLFGPNLKAWVKDFQRRLGLAQDGCVGPITLGEMKALGFKY